jgi:hypothetical protein
MERGSQPKYVNSASASERSAGPTRKNAAPTQSRSRTTPNAMPHQFISSGTMKWSRSMKTAAMSRDANSARKTKLIQETGCPWL